MRAAASKSNPSRSGAKNNPGARRRFKLWLGFMIIFIVWASYHFISLSGDIEDKNLQLAETLETQTKMEQNLSQIKYEVNRLKDPEYIGQLARKKFGLYKPGETPIHKSSDGN